MAAPAFAVFLPVLKGLRFGPMRLTPYGACAALGVLTAMALSRRAARHLGLLSEAVWNAGFFAVTSCFIASRLMLVLSDPKAFARYPLLILSLPSLTLGGLCLASVAVLVYLRRKGLPVLRMMDAFAPGGAVLAACLELGHALDGSEVGMPITLPWTRSMRGEVLYLHPVALYGGILSLLLAVALWALLRRQQRPGRVAGLALGLGGLLAFALDLITMPADMFSQLPLEPGQTVALGAMLSGTLLWTLARGEPRGTCAVVEEKFAVSLQEEAR